MRVIILAAGQGRRLLPLTESKPKALLDIGGKLLIERQIQAFVACGVRDFTVITGYGSRLMEQELIDISKRYNARIDTVFNPFYEVADNLASCWMARHVMASDFIQVNGDNVFRADLVKRLLAAKSGTVSVAVNVKDSYDADDMKVLMQNGLVKDIGKALDTSKVQAEAIGFYMFRGAGPAAYVDILERSMRDPRALKQWFPSAVASLAQEIPVGTIDVSGETWGEVDFPEDYEQAVSLVRGWDG